MTPLTKGYPTFDCDAHITEQPAIWEYLSAKEKEFVRHWFWPQGEMVVVNGNQQTPGNWGHGRSQVRGYGFHADGRRVPSTIEIAGPGTNKKLMRKLYSMDLTDEQIDYVTQKGARDPHARLTDMDQQGIDQVMVVPLMMFSAFLFVENYEAAALMARAYNDWVADWCSAAPDRLFPAAVIPVHNPFLAAEELRRLANLGFKIAMVRPVDVQGRYPNQDSFAPMWKAFEETGLVVGIHSLVTGSAVLNKTGHNWTPGLFIDKAVNPKQMAAASQTMSFAHEAQTWLTNVLLSGFLERYPGIARMAIMESNASWLPWLLEQCDKAVDLYRNQRSVQVNRRPSEIFMERCFIAFEGDEKPVYRQNSLYEDIGIWSSDVYHHDGADAWVAMREMKALGVPKSVEAKLMGGNARRMYGIEPPTRWINQEPDSYPRPDWYPKVEDVEREYAPRMVGR